MKYYLDTTLQELFDGGLISVRTFNSLRYAGMNTLEDVLNFSDSPLDLLKLRNFGRKSLEEMLPFLRDVCPEMSFMKLMMPQQVFATLVPAIEKILRESYESLFVEKNRVTNFFKETFPSVEMLHDKVVSRGSNLLQIHDGFSKTENVEIRRMFCSYLAVSTRRMQEGNYTDDRTYLAYKDKLQDLQSCLEVFSYEEIIRHFLSTEKRDFLQRLYVQMREKQLSVRGKHFVERVAPNFETLVALFQSPQSDYKKLCPGQAMEKTLTELFAFNQMLKEQFDCYWQMSEEELQAETLKRDHPYLSREEQTFVLDHQRAFGTYPLFFLLHCHMRQSEEKYDRIYSQTYGICDGVQRTWSEIAEQFGVTRERVRQILKNKMEVHETKLMQNDDWKQYETLFSLPFITQDSVEFQLLKEREHLPLDFQVFARLLQLIGGYDVEVMDNFAVVINRKAMPSFMFEKCVKTLRTQIASHHTKDTLMDVSSILNEVKPDEQESACRLMVYVAKEVLGLEVVEGQKIVLKQNCVDIFEEISDILTERGEPMSIDELFEAFKRRNPNHKFSESWQIRAYLQRDPHIKALGKTSRYGLDSWDNIFYGTIRDLLVKLLEASDVPLLVSQLQDAVKPYFPTTSANSLYTTMWISPERFVLYDGSLWGLKGKEYAPSFSKENIERNEYSFENRYADFRKFVEGNKRYPSHSGDEREASLCRWLYNVRNRILAASEEEIQRLEDSIKHDEAEFIPRTSIENNFRKNCRAYVEYVNTHHALPTASAGRELYLWFRSSVKSSKHFSDHRKKYLNDLLDFIQSFTLPLFRV